MSFNNNPQLNENEMIHEFVITYHPNKQFTPERTLTISYTGDKAETTEVVNALIKTLSPFIKTLHEDLEILKKKDENKTKLLESKTPTTSYKPLKITENTTQEYYSNLYGEDMY